MIDVGKLIGTTSTAGDTGGPAPRMSTASGMFQSLMALFGKELAAAGGEASGQGAPDAATPVGTEAPAEDGAGDGCDRKRAVLPGATVKPAMSLLTRILVARTPAHPASSTDEHDSPSPTRSLPGDPDKQADTATAVDDGQQPDFVPAEPTMLPLVTTPPAMAPTGDDNFGDDDAANASTDLQPRRRLHGSGPRLDTSAMQAATAGVSPSEALMPTPPPAAARPTGDDPPMMRPGASQVAAPPPAAVVAPAPALAPELQTGASRPASVVVEATILGRETHLPPVARPPAARTGPSAPQSSAREKKESPTGVTEHPSAALASPTTTGQPPAPERPLPLPADTNTGDADGRAFDGRDADTAAEGRKASPPGKEQAAATPAVTPAPPANGGPSATGAVVATDAGAAGLPARALAAVAAAVTNAAAPASVAPASTEAAAVPVRVFTVRLDLPDYGGVDLRMSLNDRALTLRIVADRDDTATRLRHDRDALTDLLRHGGTDASITAVDSRRADAGDGAPRAAPAPNGQGAGNGAGSGLPGGGSGRQPTGGQSPPAPPDAGLFSGPSKEITTDAPPPGAPRAGSLYV